MAALLLDLVAGVLLTLIAGVTCKGGATRGSAAGGAAGGAGGKSPLSSLLSDLITVLSQSLFLLGEMKRGFSLLTRNRFLSAALLISHRASDERERGEQNPECVIICSGPFSPSFPLLPFVHWTVAHSLSSQFPRAMEVDRIRKKR